VRQNGELRRLDEAPVDGAVDARDDLGNGRTAVAHGGKDGLLAPLPVNQIGFHRAQRTVQPAAVSGQVELVAPLEALFQRRDIAGHVAFGRRDHGRVPGHHVVAGKHRPGALHGEAEMVRRMARRVQRLDRPVGARDGVAVPEAHVGGELVVDELLSRGLMRSPGPGRVRVTAEAHDRGAGQPGEGSRAVAMVAVGVRDQDVGDGPARCRGEDRRPVGLVVGTGIDDGECRRADEVGVGALEGERARVRGDDTNDARRHRVGGAVAERHRGLEGERVQRGLCAVRTGLGLGLAPIWHGRPRRPTLRISARAVCCLDFSWRKGFGAGNPATQAIRKG